MDPTGQLRGPGAGGPDPWTLGPSTEGGDGDKLSPSWARGEVFPPELVRSTHEQSIVS